MSTTVGQLMLSRILPPDVYVPGQEIDKKSIKKILGDVAKRYPERYPEIASQLLALGKESARATAGTTFGVSDLLTPPAAAERREKLKQNIEIILSTVPEKEQKQAIVRMLFEAAKTDKNETVAELEAMGNPLAKILKGAGRGNPASISRLVASDLLYADPSNDPVPVPILNSYSRGLTPGEYVASSFGARAGISATKLSVASSGYLSKLIQSAAHRAIVTGVDGEGGSSLEFRGLPVDVDEEDNVGALLAADFGPYKRNTVLSPKIMADLDRKGFKKILVRSPLTTTETSGGVFARDVGEQTNGLPQVGESVGVTAAAALSEGVTQSSLGSKHKGGLAEDRQGLSGFELIERLLNPPKDFREAAAYAEHDGVVTSISPAEQGGHYISDGSHRYYVPAGQEVKVKIGQPLEAGDQLSDGPINPRMVVQHKGLGEGARSLTYAVRDAIKNSGSYANRRNVELVIKGLVDRVRMTDEYEDYLPNDVVPYSELIARWKPREGHRVSGLQTVQGRYLESPILHYTVGTRITPSVVNTLKQYGVEKIATHTDPPPFQSEMVRAVDLLKSDSDWQTQMMGVGLQKSLLTSAHRGAVSDEEGTSFVAARARAVDFNRKGKLKLPASYPVISLGHQ